MTRSELRLEPPRRAGGLTWRRAWRAGAEASRGFFGPEGVHRLFHDRGPSGEAHQEGEDVVLPAGDDVLPALFERFEGGTDDGLDILRRVAGEPVGGAGDVKKIGPRRAGAEGRHRDPFL